MRGGRRAGGEEQEERKGGREGLEHGRKERVKGEKELMEGVLRTALNAHSFKGRLDARFKWYSRLKTFCGGVEQGDGGNGGDGGSVSVVRVCVCACRCEGGILFPLFLPFSRRPLSWS